MQPPLPSVIVHLLCLKRKDIKEFARTYVRMRLIYRRFSNRLHKMLTYKKQHQIYKLLAILGTDASTKFALWRITKRLKVLGLSEIGYKVPAWWLVAHITGQNRSV